MCLFTEIRGIGTQASHGDAERIERLTQCSEKHIGIELAEVRMKQIGNALIRIRQQARTHHDDKQQDEQGGHHRLGSTLYALAHTTHNDNMGE